MHAQLRDSLNVGWALQLDEGEAAGELFSTWFSRQDVSHAGGAIAFLTEVEERRSNIWNEVLSRVRSHYLDPDILAAYCDQLGYDDAAAQLRTLTPADKTSRSGDLGEILAAEYINETLSTKVYVKRLRMKDERETALRGDDMLGVELTDNDEFLVLKGESKSRVALSTCALLEAEAKLLENDGRPSQHSATVVANELIRRRPKLGAALAQFNLGKLKADKLLHLIVGLTQSKPRTIFPRYLDRPYIPGVSRTLVAIVIKRHQDTIAQLFADLSNSERIAHEGGQ